MKTVTLTFLIAATVFCVERARAEDTAKTPAPAAEAAKARPAAATEAMPKPPEAPPSGPGSADRAKIDWDAMSKAERKKYMKTVVLPAAQKMFAAYDAKKYKKVTCQLCHGDGVAKGTFKMPNPELPKLPTTGEGFMALKEKKPEMVKFMGGTVKPQMAALLGMAEFTPQNPSGFGCYACHEKIP